AALAAGHAGRQQPDDHGRSREWSVAQRARLARDRAHVARRRRLLRDRVMTVPATEDRTARVVIGAVSLAVVLIVGYLLLGQRPTPGAEGLVAALPLLNACLNATSAALLSAGWVFIRRRRVTAHKICMVSALAVSILFLASYVTYHSLAGSRPFGSV